MGMMKHRFDAKTRRVYAVAMVCLTSGLALAQFEHAPWSLRHRDLYDGLRGLVLGLAIGLLLWVTRRKGKSEPAGTAQA